MVPPGPTVRVSPAHYDVQMRIYAGKVKDGRLVVDGPTDRPDGDTVELVSVDDVLANGGDLLDEADRERLHAAIDRGSADGTAGRVVRADDLITKLRAKGGSGR